MKRFPFSLIWITCFLSIVSCKKQNEWLDAPRTHDEITLENLIALQGVLDNTFVLNVNYPSIGQLACDHYYLTDQVYNAVEPTERNSYVWSRDIFESRSSFDYDNGYLIIAYANIVLDGLEKIEPSRNQLLEFNNIKGQALFFRSMLFFELASTFCKPYSAQTAPNDLGLSLRLSSDVNEIKQRSSLKATYDQILNDLLTASQLVAATPKYKTRPSKQAVYALLARVWLNMGDFAKAKEFSDSVFTYGTELMDFNNGGPSLSYEYRFPPFKVGNKEVIFYSEGAGYTGIVPDINFNTGFVDTSLYRSYDETDLRKKFFYEYQGVNQVRFRGTYTGGSSDWGANFAGLGMNEIYLISAECNARLNNMQASLETLNKLLVRRYEQGKYTNYYTDDADTLLSKILLERKKELPFTGQIRWQDLRRLNTDPRFATYINRRINGQVVTLAPNDKKYVYPIPQNEIDRTGIEQNER